MYQVTQWVISSPPVLICPPPHLHQWHITLPVWWNQLELSGCEHERRAYCFLSLQVYLMHVTSYVWVPFISTGSVSVSAVVMVRHPDILICAGFMRHSGWSPCLPLQWGQLVYTGLLPHHVASMSGASLIVSERKSLLKHTLIYICSIFNLCY